MRVLSILAAALILAGCTRCRAARLARLKSPGSLHARSPWVLIPWESCCRLGVDRIVQSICEEHSLISADRKRIICEYDAADAETLRRIQREAGAQFGRVWVGNVVELAAPLRGA